MSSRKPHSSGRDKVRGTNQPVKRSYVVSGLSPDHKNQQPVMDPRHFPSKPAERRTDEIFIPSVASLEHDSPRSINTDGSMLTWQSMDGKMSPSRPFSPGMINEVERGTAPDALEQKDHTVATQHLTADSDYGQHRALLGNRLKVENESVKSLRQRIMVPMNQESISGAPPQLMDDELSVNSDVTNVSRIHHFSSGNSVNIFENKQYAPDAHLWGSARTQDDAPREGGLWGEDEGNDVQGTTMLALETQLMRERSRKQIEALTQQLQADTPTKQLLDAASLDLQAVESRKEPQSLYEESETRPVAVDNAVADDDELSLKGHSVVEDYLSLNAEKTTGDARPSNPSTRPSTRPGTRPDTGGATAAEAAAAEALAHMAAEEAKLSESIVPVSTDALNSKTRENLKNLGKYVYGHTNRKIMVAWTPIESRFTKSAQKKVEMVKDASGLSHPHKRPALFLSALTGILCSSSIRCTWQELTVLYGKLGCTPADVFKSRQLAAIKVVLGPGNGAGLRARDELLGEMAALMEDEEPLISMEQLKDVVFPSDPKERQKELDSLEAEKATYIQQMVADKEKREAMAKAIKTRKEKMIQDFDESISEIQFPKGVLQLAKLNTFKELIEYLKTAYHKAHAVTDVKVSDELVALLGLECFPACVHKSIKETQDRMRAEHAKYAYKPGDPKPNLSKKKAVGDSKSPSLSGSEESAAAETSTGGKKANRHDMAKNLAKLSEKSKVEKPLPVKKTIKRIGYQGEFRILLQQPVSDIELSLIKLIREVVSYGKGLNGMAYRDVVEIIQAYSTTRLQSRWRCHKRQWRYKAARSCWRVIFTNIKTKFFKAWAIFIRHVYDTRNFCWRKLRAWHTYTKNAKKRREHFRINFWPFYIWHRFAARSRTAKEKASFLAYRVEPTVRMLRVFRGWKHYYQDEKNLRDTADEFNDMVLRYRARICLAWHRRWTRRRIRIRKHWYKYGVVTYKRKIFVRKLTPFLIWKCLWFYRRELHRRIVVYTPSFRNGFHPTPPKRMPTLSERKRVAREKYEASGGDKKRRKEARAAKRAGKAGEDASESSGGEESRTSSKASKKPTKLMKPFIFQAGPRYRSREISSDGEEEEHTSSRMQDNYRELDELVSPVELDFLAEADEFIFDKILILYKRFIVVDTWNLLEWSMHYHRSMHRAIRNLLSFAKASKNARKSRNSYMKKLKRKCFMAMFTWMCRDPNNVTTDQTDAERMYAEAKSYRQSKMIKWREIANEIKSKLGRDDDDEGKFDLSTPPKHVIRARKARRLEKEAKLAADIAAGIPIFEPPNFLEWDRSEREHENEKAEVMLKLSKKLRVEAFAASAKAEGESALYDKAENELNNTVVTVFNEEDRESNKALDNEMEYIDKFKIHAAGNLVDVMGKIYKEVQIMLAQAESKKYFRALRMPMIIQRSYAMLNRKRMVNWIRICRRLASLYDHAPVYYTRRKVWVVFNRWLKLVEHEALDVTPGLVPYIKRKCQLFPKFSDRLKANNINKTVYVSSKRLLSISSDLGSVFYRWLMTISEEKMFRLMGDKVGRCYEVKLLQRVFWSLKTLMTPEETYEPRKEIVPFCLVRAKCDVDQITKRFIATRRKNYQIVISSYNRRYTFYSMRAAKKAPSFKRFLAYYKWSISRRLSREQRIMVDSFDLRGTQQYMDICCPALDSKIMPPMMRRLDGKVFRDPHPLSGDEFSQLMPVLPGGFRVAKIRINHQEVNGSVDASVTGWQIVWSGDGIADIEGHKRGKWKGAAMVVHEFVVPKDDFVKGVEYIYDGADILGVRIKCFFSGFSRWLGGKPSIATLSIYLDCELAPRQPFEDDYTSPGRDETENPALPRTYVIGFTGAEYNGKVSGLGLISRKIKEQHIFSYHWVNDAILKKQEGGGSDARVIGNDKAKVKPKTDDDVSIDIQSFPSNIDTGRYGFTKGQGNVSISESLTISLPPVTGAKAVPVPDDSSVLSQDVSSIGAGEAGGSAAVTEVNLDDNGSMSAGNAIVQLTNSEEQFFDVLRMRSMEVTTAQQRAENFGRRLWSARHLRNDPILVKLTTITIIAPLTKWLFQAISKRLVHATSTEDKGEQMLEGARLKRQTVDKLTRQSVAEFLRRDELVNTPQPWQDLMILSPKERMEKKLYYEKIRQLSLEAEESRDRAKALLQELLQEEKIGRMYLPRMQLSEFVCLNFRRKIGAARHKETLLERMDMDAIKRALSGGDAKISELSDVSMEMIRSSLAGKKGEINDEITLDKVIEAELAKAHQQKKKISLQVPNSSGIRSRPNTGPSGSSTDVRSEEMYLKSHDDYRSSMHVPSYRRVTAINPLNKLSNQSITLNAKHTIGERTLQSSSSEQFLRQQQNSSAEHLRSKQKLMKKLMSKSLDLRPKDSAAADLDLADRILGNFEGARGKK